jgi:hypothetical protein
MAKNKEIVLQEESGAISQEAIEAYKLEEIQKYKDEVEIETYKVNKCFADTVWFFNTVKTLRSSQAVQDSRSFINGRMTPNIKVKIPACTFVENTTFLHKYTEAENEKIKQKYREVIQEIDRGKLKTPTQVFDATYTKTLEMFKVFDSKIAEYEKHFKEDVESSVQLNLSKLNSTVTQEERLAAEKEFRGQCWSVINANHWRKERSNLFAELEFEKGTSDFFLRENAQKDGAFVIGIEKHLTNALKIPDPKKGLGTENFIKCKSYLLVAYEILGPRYVKDANKVRDELDIFIRNATPKEQGVIYDVEINIGYSNLTKHKWETALKWLTKAHKTAEKGKVEMGTAFTLICKGDTHVAHHQADETTKNKKRTSKNKKRTQSFAIRQHNELLDVALECYREGFEHICNERDIASIQYIHRESHSVIKGLEYIAKFHEHNANYEKSLVARELIGSIFDKFISVSENPIFDQNPAVKTDVAKFIGPDKEKNTLLISVAKKMIEIQATKNKESEVKKQQEASLLLQARSDYDNKFGELIKKIEVDEKAAEVKTKHAIDKSEKLRKEAAAKLIVSNVARSTENTDKDKLQVPTEKPQLATQLQMEYISVCNQGVGLLEQKKFNIAERRFKESLTLLGQKNDKSVEALSYWGLAECDAAKAREALSKNNISEAVDHFSQSLNFIGKGAQAISYLKSAKSNINQELLDSFCFMSKDTSEMLQTIKETMEVREKRQQLRYDSVMRCRADKIFEMGRNHLKHEKDDASEELFKRSANVENLLQEEIDRISTKGWHVWRSNPNPKNVEANERQNLEVSLQEVKIISQKVSNVMDGFGYVSNAIKKSSPIESLEKYTGISSVKTILQSDFPVLPLSPKKEVVEPKSEEATPWVKKVSPSRERSKSINDLESPKRDVLRRTKSDPCLLYGKAAR